jgi:protein tyrosine phosphatase (PTP) superfamily phosphohydrolase (DUF442 family)
MSAAVARVQIGAILLALAGAALVGIRWNNNGEKHLSIVLPGRLIRGAWQSPEALRAIIARERIKTIVTLTAINCDDPKYVGQAKVVNETGVSWLIVPMRGSRATLEQMAQSADLLADTERQPVFFHCVAGHHRTSLAHAAYLIRCRGWTAAAAWKEVANLPWARPAAEADQNDKALIDEFAGFQRSLEVASPSVTSEVHDDEEVTLAPNHPLGREAGRRDHDRLAVGRGLESSESQFRRGATGTSLSLGSDAGLGPRPDSSRTADQDRPQPARIESIGIVVSRRNVSDP